MLRISLLICSLCLLSCGEGGQGRSSLTEGVAAITTALSGMLDDQANESYSFYQQRKTPFFQFLDSLKMQKAFAASCTRTVNETCNSGIRSNNLEGCDYTNTITAKGSVILSYSDASCTMLSNTNYVTRTYSSVELTGVRGYTLAISSDNDTNYENSTFSGGVRLTRNSNDTYNYAVLGLHKKLQGSGGSVVYSHSMKSTSNSTLSNEVSAGSLQRNGRVLSGGEIKVYHNKAEFTASYVPSNLKWTSDCCHPTSGSWNITLSGQLTGTATVSYSSSCGSATLTRDGETSELGFSYCE